MAGTAKPLNATVTISSLLMALLMAWRTFTLSRPGFSLFSISQVTFGRLVLQQRQIRVFLDAFGVHGFHFHHEIHFARFQGNGAAGASGMIFQITFLMAGSPR